MFHHGRKQSYISYQAELFIGLKYNRKKKWNLKFMLTAQPILLSDIIKEEYFSITILQFTWLFIEMLNELFSRYV